MTGWIEAAAFVCGIGLSVLLALFPRDGATSRRLLLLILPASLSAGILALGPAIAGFSPQDAIRASLALIILASAGGCFAAGSLVKTIKKIQAILLICVPAALVALLYSIEPPYAAGLVAPDGYIALGLSGYISSLFLLIISVIVLASLEQSLRNGPRHGMSKLHRRPALSIPFWGIA